MTSAFRCGGSTYEVEGYGRGAVVRRDGRRRSLTQLTWDAREEPSLRPFLRAHGITPRISGRGGQASVGKVVGDVHVRMTPEILGMLDELRGDRSRSVMVAELVIAEHRLRKLRRPV